MSPLLWLVASPGGGQVGLWPWEAGGDSPTVLSFCRMMGCVAAGPAGKRRSPPALSPRLRCVFQSFFGQVLFTHSAQLQELLCPGPCRHGGLSGRGPVPASWLTCHGGEWAECSQVAGDSGDLVLEQKVEFFFLI